MTPINTKVAMLSNPFSTGGGGYYFERRVQAVFILSLLVEGFSPVLNCPIKEISFQTKRLGYDIDDLLVIGHHNGQTQKLLCQIKHSLRITENDGIFQEVVAAAWSDFNKKQFNTSCDKVMLATGMLAKDSVEALRTIHDQANAVASASEFFLCIEQANYISDTVRNKLDVIKVLITRANEHKPASNEELWRFCKAFTLLVFDLDYESSLNQTLIQSLTRCNSTANPDFIWSSLTEFAGSCNKSGATISYNDIPHYIRSTFGKNKAKATTYFTEVSSECSDILVKLALVGSWDENNEEDRRCVEAIAQVPYQQFDHSIRQLLLQYPDLLTLQNGIWSVGTREAILSQNNEQIFDETIKNAFAQATQVLMEEHARFRMLDPERYIKTSKGDFSNSDDLRMSLLTGICLLANMNKPKHCSEDLILLQGKQMIRNVFSDCTWQRLASLYEMLPLLAEIDPDAYLYSLEKTVIDKPAVFENLFPKQNDRRLFSNNYISSVLWSIESTAWEERFLVRAVRCLAELEKVTHDETNYSNTPINSIVSILLPWYPQTLASIDTHKKAIICLCNEYPEVGWTALKKLFPYETSSTAGTYKPKYRKITIPNDIAPEADKVNSLYSFLFSKAVEIAKEKSEKLQELIKYMEYAEIQTIESFFTYLASINTSLSDEIRYSVWNKLCDLKYRIQREKNEEELVSDSYIQLENLIADYQPQSLIYQLRRLYEATCDEYSFDVDGWEKREIAQAEMVAAIYEQLGDQPLIEIGCTGKNAWDIGYKCGKVLNQHDMLTLSERFVVRDLQELFYSGCVNGYTDTHGVSSLVLVIEHFQPECIAFVLSQIRMSKQLVDCVTNTLGSNEQLFWERVHISAYQRLDEYDDLNIFVTKLTACKRTHILVNLLGTRKESLSRIGFDEICNIMESAAFSEENESIDQYAVHNIVRFLQENGKAQSGRLSNIEFLYLPFLDEYSSVKPKALFYQLGNDAGYFTSMIEMTYRKKSAQETTKLPESIQHRLFDIFFKFRVIPGTDWNGEFHPDVFKNWVQEVLQWADENERNEVVQITVGNGLSYASVDDDGMPHEAIVTELNKPANQSMRNGYTQGIRNQRGAYWVDPTGKPEKELAAMYEQRAQNAEQAGFSRFADALRMLSQDYLAEAKENMRREQASE